MSFTSVIIPYRDRLEALERTLSSIRDYSDAEILVVDEGSTLSGATKICREYLANHYRLPAEKGRPFRAAAARNAGAAFVRGSLLLFNDVDVVHKHGAIDELEKLACRFGLQVLCPRVFFRQRDGTSRDPRSHIYGDPGALGLSKEWLFAWVTLAAVPRLVFNAVGGFDQRFEGWSVEDMDFAYRVARQGFEFYYTDCTNGVHFPHPDQVDKPETSRQGLKYFEEKHGFPLPCVVAREDGIPVEVRSPQ